MMKFTMQVLPRTCAIGARGRSANQPVKAPREPGKKARHADPDFCP
ncbi:hypothetical protein F441_10990 [Phytophthora nicotianae CJ01A1]|uniref:Uncharacterized protein n=2 Tax=Phytophthora nicotianae TaxID=4792 RepID=W2L0E3_PHYNI|nr:hypothetical protein L916_10690 [Phytophthora nicotianae]ETL90832.1 hypothetical protein L917_10589 [Phytophthora nicotianae]ETM44126.1 hypothetical protein L914_10639 [Phytophthora nicotianae]ETP14054.1 hypothetical protein F441_10990 [Phytophthora nicotianae CJ01A1]